MNRLQNIQALRGVAALAVLFFHLTFIENRFGGGESLLPGWLQFGMFGVDLFFVISGFVMVTVARGKFQQTREALKFLYHRISRIYPLYWVYTSVALTVFLVMPGWVNSSQGNQVNILASYLLLPDDLLPLVQVGWSLIHEVYFYLVFFLILLTLPERFLVSALLLWAGVVTWLSTRISGPYLNIIFNPLTLEFIAGCFIGWHFYNFKPIKASGILLNMGAGFGLIAAIVGFMVYNANLGGLPLGWWQVLVYGVPATLIVFCAIHAERNGSVLPNFLIQNGNASYSIYLSHLFTINVVGRIWGYFAVTGLFDNFIALSLAAALAVLAGFISYWYVEAPLLNLTRKAV